MDRPASVKTAGDSALVVEFGNEISENISNRVRAMQAVLEHEQHQGITELVPTYRSLMVHYDPRTLTYQQMSAHLHEAITKMEDLVLPSPKIIEIPTLYGGDAGPDLVTVARHNGLDEEEVIHRHSGRDYLIYMLGFTPGFPYLGGMDPRIATPRLDNPRSKIKGGSVGIAGNQTGIYSIDSPGGWQIIGWTPVPLFDPGADQPFLLKAGNYMRFIPVSTEECARIQQLVESREYHCKTHRYHDVYRQEDVRGGGSSE